MCVWVGGWMGGWGGGGGMRNGKGDLGHLAL